MASTKGLGLAKETSLLFFVKVFGAVFAFVLQVVLNFLVGTEAYGEISTYLSVGAVLITLFCFGSNTGLVKQSAISKSSDEDKVYIRNALLILSIGALVFFALLLIVFSAQLGIESPEFAAYATIGVYSIFGAVSSMYTGFFQGKKKTLYANVLDIVVYNLLLIVTIAVVSRFSTNTVYLLAAYALVMAVISLWKVLRAKRIIDTNHSGTLAKDSDSNRNSVQGAWVFFCFCVPFCLITLCGNVETMAIKIILTQSMGSFDVGVFRILETYVSCMSLFASPFVTLWPYMAQAYDRNEMDQLESIYSKSIAIIAVLVVPTVVSMLVCCKEVYAIFGLDFLLIENSFWAMALMIFAGAFDAIVGPAGALLNMTRYGKANLAVTVISTAISLVLCFLLAPAIGLLGAAISASLHKVIANTATATLNYRLLGMWPYTKRLFAFVGTSIFLYIVGYAIYSLLPDVLVARIVSIAVIEVLLSCLVFVVIYRSDAKTMFISAKELVKRKVGK